MITKENYEDFKKKFEDMSYYQLTHTLKTLKLLLKLMITYQTKWIFDKYAGFCHFTHKLYINNVIGDEYDEINYVLSQKAIDPRECKENRLGVRYSIRYSNKESSSYFFKPHNYWRRILWLKRTIKRIENRLKELENGAIRIQVLTLVVKYLENVLQDF